MPVFRATGPLTWEIEYPGESSHRQSSKRLRSTVFDAPPVGDSPPTPAGDAEGQRRGEPDRTPASFEREGLRKKTKTRVRVGTSE